MARRNRTRVEDPEGNDSVNEPRFVRVSRRRFLGNAAVGGAFISVTGLTAAACGNSDADVFSSESAPEITSTSDSPATTASTTSSEATTTSVDATSSTDTTTPTETVASTEGASATNQVQVPSGEMLLSFAYTPDGTGKQENPYIAVWVETPDGELDDTVALWYEQSQKGDKWIDDLRSWYDASNRAANVTMSAATRTAGSYTVAWDLTDTNGNTPATTDLVLFVESARERGPHHITSTTISILDRDTGALSADGELHDLSISWA